MPEKNISFFTILFDLRFRNFITLRFVSVLYAIGIVLAALVALTAIVTGFSAGVGRGILALILSPLFFLIYVVLIRLWLEILVVIFRIAENTSRLVEIGEDGVSDDGDSDDDSEEDDDDSDWDSSR